MVLHTEGLKCCPKDCPSESRVIDASENVSSVEECIEICDAHASCQFFSHHSDLKTCVYCSSQPTNEWTGAMVYSMKGTKRICFNISHK